MNSMFTPGRVVAGVDDDHGPGAERLAVQQAGAPVRHVGGVERRLEQLVLQQHPLIGPEPAVDGGQCLGEPVLPRGDVVLTGVVGAVGEPELEVPRAGGVHDVDALQQVGEGLLAHPRVGVAHAAELVVVVLEDVGVDGADADALARGVRGEGGVVVGLVPGDVHGHARGDSGVRVHLRGVAGLLVGGARHAGLAEHLEPGPAVPERPRWQLDLVILEGVLDRGQVTHSGSSPLVQVQY
jgi:hypothetical protein